MGAWLHLSIWQHRPLHENRQGEPRDAGHRARESLSLPRHSLQAKPSRGPAPPSGMKPGGRGEH